MESAQFRMRSVKFADLESATKQRKHRFRVFMADNRLGAVARMSAGMDNL